MANGAPTVFLSAGEPSGDVHGAALAEALAAAIPGVRLLGLGGSRMAAAGVELLAELDDLAVMGFAEVVARLPFFLGLRNRVFSALESRRVDIVIPIDYPGFNLRLANRATNRGIPVLYYIAPQVWAWHASRVKDLARDTRRIAVILPFEEEFLRGAGANAEFVGHPLLDVEPTAVDRAGWLLENGLDPDRPVLALFPGSRRQEVERLLGRFSEASDMVRHEMPEVQPVVGASPDLPASLFEGIPWPVVRQSGELLGAATAALVKSGTTTLEAALAGTPLVVAYRMNPVSFAIGRRLVKVPHIALANLVVGERVVPELVQNEASPEALAAAVLPLLRAGSPERELMLRGLEQVRVALGEPGAAARVAGMAVDLLENAR